MDTAGYHDFFLAASAALPILYVPVVLTYYDRSKAAGADRETARTLLAAMIVFANAEAASLGQIVRFAGESDRHVPATAADLTAILLIAAAVILGATVAVAPFTNDLFGMNIRTSKPRVAPRNGRLRLYVAYTLVAGLVSAGPAYWMARGFDLSPTPLGLVVLAAALVLTPGAIFVHTRRTSVAGLTAPQPRPLVEQNAAPSFPATEVEILRAARSMVNDYLDVPRSIGKRSYMFADRYLVLRTAVLMADRREAEPAAILK